MDQEEAVALVQRQSHLIERTATLCALLHQVVERTGRQVEGYGVLYLINCMTFQGRAEIGRVEDDPVAVLRGVCRLSEQICATLEQKIEELEV